MLKIILFFCLFLLSSCSESNYNVIDKYNETVNIIIRVDQYNEGDRCGRGCFYPYTFCNYIVLSEVTQDKFIIKDKCGKYSFGDKISIDIDKSN